MLIKEYRIPLPMSVEEYRIAQLYMIQKKSLEESKGAGSGVEILVNEPYEKEDGRKGQYTHKVYHIGNHLPGWFRAILPKSALRVEEEAWNAYPYTKTRFTCPFVEKFFIEVETYYLPDRGNQENVFKLTSSELKNRILDLIDVAKDPVSSSDYKKQEDPNVFQSSKTGRGPLPENWLAIAGQKQGADHGLPEVMCAYKLCKVEFRYWGMQNRIEKFIHDIGLRKVMLHAHRQAWCWQDEYHGLTIEDIRELEEKAAQELAEKMAAALEDEDISPSEKEKNKNRSNFNRTGYGRSTSSEKRLRETRLESYSQSLESDENDEEKTDNANGTFQRKSSRRKSASAEASSKNQMMAQWRMDSLQADSDTSDEEFFDAQEDMEDALEELTHWGTACNLGMGDDLEASSDTADHSDEGSAFVNDTSSPLLTTSTSVLFIVLHGGNILDGVQEFSAKQSDINTFKASFDAVIRAHFPVAVDHVAVRWVACPSVCSDAVALLSGLNPYSISARYKSGENGGSAADFIPIGALPLLVTGCPQYSGHVTTVINRANIVYHEFVKSPEGQGFNGQICLIGDSVGSILGYDALCRGVSIPSSTSSTCGSQASIDDSDALTINFPSPSVHSPSFPNDQIRSNSQSFTSANEFNYERPVLRRKSETTAPLRTSHRKRFSNPCVLKEVSFTEDMPLPTPFYEHTESVASFDSTVDKNLPRLEFEVGNFFLFGSQLGIVITQRMLTYRDKSAPPPKPACGQVFNMFHRTDPSASRIEPLLHQRFSLLPPSWVERYQKFPLGDGHTVNLGDVIQSNSYLFLENIAGCLAGNAMASRGSICSQLSIDMDANGVSHIASFVNSISSKWWGDKRLDYSLYCPEALQSFPTGTLPHLFHASYWESTDVVAFILRQVFQNDHSSLYAGDRNISMFSPNQPREKWQRKRTAVKMKQSTHPNHRANDVMVLEGDDQIITARFMYGSLDMVTLTGEKVDLFVMTQPPNGEWVHFDTLTTNNHGRINYIIPQARRLGHGIYPVKMVVRGDHTSADCYLTVLPPCTDCVVFSIDGSFTASVSIMGRDPKVRAGAVDVVRHWQELGYLVIYITARPSMQKQKVVAWLAQHNFPHGMVQFCDSITTDPLRQKTNILKNLIDNARIVIHAAYGSGKDISVYSSVGMKAEQIYIIGKASKKHQSQAQLLSDGYSAHLEHLVLTSCPSAGNSRMVLRKGCFSLPGFGSSARSAKTTAYRSKSYQCTAIPSGHGYGLGPRSMSQSDQRLPSK
ncbi:protein retinal degeneration B-like [Anneissia japonica]|uniref:protein retinal degeneration B-like n=1 Tax=Anneissia japonica TaxID=1529436 RepID=UPI00142581C9|nr:protein retinal degeneration B-like [Anneissia japonica]